MCAERQRGILQDVWQALKPNGILTYSTCTFNRAENEDNVHWIAENLGAEILKIDTAAFPEITETDGGYRFYPHRTKGEGFFLSVLRKSDNENNVCRLKLKNKIPKKINFSDFSEIKLKTSDFDFIEKNNIIKAYSVNKKEEILFIEENLHCLMAGLEMGEIKGKDFIPAHTLAMSKAFDFQHINTVDADYKTAIYYLKKTTIYLENAPLGYNLLCFENAPLGWVKNLGNRCNNLYPANWRIKMNFDENY
jgi:NOL1/NOP2/fmu family ribosome biogenesis protein